MSLGQIKLNLNKKQFLINLFKIVGLSTVLLFVLSYIQSECWQHATFFISSYHEAVTTSFETFDEVKYFDLGCDAEKLQTLFTQMFVTPISGMTYFLIPNNDAGNLPMFRFTDFISHRTLIPEICFYLLPLIFLFKNFKKSAHKQLITTFLIAMLLNCCFYFFYGFDECFLYSQNYLFIPFILLGITIAESKNKFLETTSKFFFLYELFINFILINSIMTFFWQITLHAIYPERILEKLIIYVSLVVLIYFATRKFISTKSPLYPKLRNLSNYFVVYLFYIIIFAQCLRIANRGV